MSFSINIVDDQLDALITGDTPVIAKFWSPMCGACRIVAPAFNELAEQCLSKVWFLNAQAEQVPQTLKTYGVDKLPTLILFRNGQEVDRLIGAPNYRKLISFVQQAL